MGKGKEGLAANTTDWIHLRLDWQSGVVCTVPHKAVVARAITSLVGWRRIFAVVCDLSARDPVDDNRTAVSVITIDRRRTRKKVAGAALKAVSRAVVATGLRCVKYSAAAADRGVPQIECVSLWSRGRCAVAVALLHVP